MCIYIYIYIYTCTHNINHIILYVSYYVTLFVQGSERSPSAAGPRARTGRRARPGPEYIIVYHNMILYNSIV